MMHRRHLVSGPLAFLPIVAALSLVGCAGLGGPPTVTISAGELEQIVERSFPIDRRFLEMLDVSVKSPKVSLLPERNRVAVVLGVRARDRVFANNWQGQLSFDAALRWESADQSLHLTQVRVQDLALDNPGAATRTAAERMGGALAERVLEDMSLYRLTPEKLAQLQSSAGLPGLAPSAVTVTSRGVEITFAPVAK